MAETTGVSPEVLALPRGGGAVQGLGATFEVDLNSGAGSFGIPIDVPAGPNGLQPRIVLKYQSTSGNGPFGLGWSLGVLAIARDVEHAVPTLDEADRFVLLGGDELVEVAPGRYRPRVDTMYWRIERVGHGWLMTDTRGQQHRLGRSSPSRIEIEDETGPRAAVWLLEEMEDTSGNRVSYHYRAEATQRYLDRVRWGTYELRFLYEPRPDPLTHGRYGFLVTTDLRCLRIELHETSEQVPLVRSWTLEYRQASGSGLTLLARVVHRGHDASGAAIEAPPVTLGYTEPRPPTLSRLVAVDEIWSPPLLRSGRIELVDWDGDGLPDLLELAPGVARVWPNLGRGRLGVPRQLDALPVPIAMDEPGVAFADMAGNGTADLVWMDRPLSGYYPLRPGGGFEPPVFWRRQPSARLADKSSRLVDLDGDRTTDLLVSGDRFFQLYYRRRDGWDSEPGLVPRRRAPAVSLDDPRVHIADMNGDGLPDLVRVDGGGVVYWPYLGRGRWGAETRLERAPDLPRDFDPRRLRLSDLDGDGCADLVYVDFDRVLYWYNRGGHALGERREVPYTPAATLGDVRWADMNGTGAAGVLWSIPLSRRRGYFYLDLSGGRKPYLLDRVDNGVGLETRVAHAPSTEFAIDDRERQAPWRTFHPFPLHCVSRIEARDRTTGVTRVTRYAYHEGRYDPVARTFLGFGRVDVEVQGDESIPSMRTENVYHLGVDPAAPDRALTEDERFRLGALRRRLLRSGVYGLDGGAREGRPFRVVQHEYDVRAAAATDGQRIAEPLLRRTVEEHWERGEQAFAVRELDYEDYDEHGNLLRQRTRVTRRGLARPDSDVVLETTYARNPDRHCVALPAEIRQRTPAGGLLGAQVRLYDGLPHQGLPPGEVERGHLTVQQDLALTDELVAEIYGESPPDLAALGYRRRDGAPGWWIDRVSLERVEEGGTLALVARDPRGAETRLDYDDTRQYPRRVTDAAGNLVEGVAARRVFQMSSLRDANGHVVTDVFDPLGRVVAVAGPGDSAELPGTEIDYRTATLPVGVASRQRERQGAPPTLDAYEYFSGSGQLLRRVTEGEGDPGRRFVVSAREYTARGQVAARYHSFYADAPDYAPVDPQRPHTRIRYDALGRRVEERRADGTRTEQVLEAGRILYFDEREAARPAPQSRVPRIYHLDGAERIVAVEHVIEGRSVVARFEYDELGRLRSAALPDGGVSTVQYDLLGRLLRETSPATGATRFVLDAAGNQVQRISEMGRVTEHRYDVLGRLVESRERGAERAEVGYEYLDAGDAEPPDGLRNRRGRVLAITDRLGTVRLAYDEAGRVVESRRTVAALGGHELITEVEHDALGRQALVRLPAPAPGAGRRVVEYRYDSRGLPASSPGFVRLAEHDVRGALTRLVFQNGVDSRMATDALTGRPERHILLGPDQVPLRDQRYAFDEIGNLARIDSPRPEESVQIEVDALSRLTGATYGSGEVYRYAYDDSGNLTHCAGLGDLLYDGPAGRGQVTRAGADAYAYDADGHLRVAPYGRLGFDAFDNLVSVETGDGRRIENVYDYRGQRAATSTSDGAQSLFVGASVEVHDGRVSVWVEFAGMRIAAVDESGRAVFMHADLWGTPTLFTAADGTELLRLGFGPYGTPRFATAGEAIARPRRFTGQPYDPETGLIALGRRFFDPRLGRFVSPDRVVGGLYRVDAWNRYVYAHNNPFRYVDPVGTDALGDFFAGLATAGLAVAAVAMVVAGFATAGATWPGASVTASALFGGAMGISGGMVAGGISAAVEGGNILQGMLFGSLVGGLFGAIGGGVGGLAFQYPLFGAQWLGYVAQGAFAGTFAGMGTGAALAFAGGAGKAHSFFEHVWKGAVVGLVLGAALGAGAAYVSENPYLNIGTTANFETARTDAWTAIDLSTNKGLGTIADMVTASSAESARLSGQLGFFSAFVELGTVPSGNSIWLGWAPGLLMNAGVYHTPALTLMLDKYDVVEIGDLAEAILGLVPFYWVAAVAGIEETSWFRTSASEVNEFYPSRK